MEIFWKKEYQRANRALKNIARHQWVSISTSNNHSPRIIANSFPKSGTHLLSRCLDLMPPIRAYHQGVFLANNEKMSVGARRNHLQRMKGGCYVSAHLPYTNEIDRSLDELGFKHLLIVRDLRDIAVSYYRFEMKYRWLPYHNYLNNLPDDDTRLKVVIGGDEKGYHGLLHIFDKFYEWQAHGALVVRFEDLIGEKGGGSSSAQLETIKRISHHLEIHLSGEQCQYIAGNIFNSNAQTFRKGIIGDWQNHFKEEHKVLFKQIGNEHLIRLGYESDDHW